MKINKITEGLTFGAKEQNYVLNYPGIKVGYEAEFWLPGFVEDMSSGSVDLDSITTYLELETYFIVSRRDKVIMDDNFIAWMKEKAEILADTSKYIDLAEEELGTSVFDDDYDEDKVKDKAYDLALDDVEDEHSLDDYITSVGAQSIVSDLRLAPSYGWADTNETAVYVDNPNHEGPTYEEYLEVLQYINNKLPFEIEDNYGGARVKDIDQYYLDMDSSVKDADNRDHGGMGLEITSPPMDISKCFESIGKTFEFIWQHGETNTTTGFHVGVSLEGFDINKIDKLKLALFISEHHVLQAFGRLSSYYSASILDHIVYRLQRNEDIKNDPTLENITKAAWEAITNDKNRTINFGKLKSGYLEFRATGGNYIRKESKIKETILRYAYAFILAADPQAMRKEYYKRLYKLITDNFTHKVIPNRAFDIKMNSIEMKVAYENLLRLKERPKDFTVYNATTAINTFIDQLRSNYNNNDIRPPAKMVRDLMTTLNNYPYKKEVLKNIQNMPNRKNQFDDIFKIAPKN